MKNKLWVAPLALTFTLGACKDVLTEKPTAFVTTESFYNTVDALEKGMLSGWGNLRSVFPGSYNGWSGFMQTMSDQDASNPDEVNSPRNVARLDYSAANMQGLDVGWENLYRLIYRENIVLSGADAVTSGDQTKKAQVIAQAKFLRGFAYMWLDRMHSAGPKPSDLSVPLILTEADQAKTDVPRATSQDVQTQVIKDLTDAEAGLPTASQRGTSGRGRPTKGAAEMALADLYLWRSSYMGTNEWQQVADWTQKVIDSAQYSLVQTGWFNVFNPGVKAANNENIFFMVASGVSGRQNSSYINEYGPRMLGFDTGGGFGVNVSTTWMRNQYPAGDIRGRVGPVDRTGTNQSDTMAFRTTGCNTSNKCMSTLVFNPRPAVAGGGIDTLIYSYKFRPSDLIAANGNVDEPLYRYAETLLMNAEAQNELGQTAKAIGLINQVRARARKGATGSENCAQPADLPTTLTKAQTRDAVFDERNRELYGEGKRWIDLVRRDSEDPGYWAASLQHDPQPLSFDPQMATRTFKKRLPIPQRDIDVDPALTQNPGY